MTELEWAERFISRFALPLVRGETVQVGGPLGFRGVRRLAAAIAAGLYGTTAGEALATAREQRLLELVPAIGGACRGEDPAEALLLVGLHDLLFLHHPAAARLSQRQVELLHGCVRTLGARAAARLPRDAVVLPEPGAQALVPKSGAAPRQLALAEERLLGRHSLLGGVFRLWRGDTRAPTLWGEREYRGMMPPPQRLRTLLGRTQRALPARRRVQVLPELLLAPESAATLQGVFAASPLTALLPPVGCGLAPELGRQAAWLRLPLVARLVVARYLALGPEPGIAAAGSAVSALLQKSRRDLPSGDLMTLLCLVSHLHLCLAASTAPLPTAHATEEARTSYALYAVVAERWPLLSAPHDVLSDLRLGPRYNGYVQACRAAAGPARLRALDELCLDALAAGPGPGTGEKSAPPSHKEPDVVTRA